MSKYGEIREDGTLCFVRILPGSIERAWEWLVDSEKRALWLAAGDMEPYVGGKVELKFDNNSLTPHDDPVTEKYTGSNESAFEGEILIYQPPHALSFHWPDKDGGVGEVTFRLSQEGDAVKLELTHSNISDRDDLLGASAGWHRHLDIMTDKLADIVPGPFWSIHDALEQEYKVRFKSALDDM